MVVTGRAPHASVSTTDSAFVEIPFEVEFLKGENDVRISGVTSSNVALDCLKVTQVSAMAGNVSWEDGWDLLNLQTK